MAVTVIRQWERANEEDNEEVLILVTVVPIIPNIINCSVLILVKKFAIKFCCTRVFE